MTGVDAGGDRLRRLRREFEAASPPAATSLDGRGFTFEAPPSLTAQVGGYVRVDTTDGPVLGQVQDLELVRRPGPEVEVGGHRTRLEVAVVTGWGSLLDEVPPFYDAPLAPADPAEVTAAFERRRSSRARLTVGEVLRAPGLAVDLDAVGFARHTFLCGQSGSGKSYALGRVLEQLIARTELRIVVLDPNSDCVSLGQTRADAPAADVDHWRRLAPRIAVRRAGAAGDERLRLRFFDLDPRTRAAVLGLDPLADREEYGAFLEVLEREAAGAPIEQLLREGITSGADPHLARLALRVRNLGLLEWGTWSGVRSDPGLLGDLERDDWRCLVVDLGSVAVPAERSMVAAAVLGHLWERRADRRPVLVVMDEAHNLCPQLPDGPLQRLTTELSVAIAGEGRKYGLYLLLASQRPQKVHENVLSQCDNLMLMRMASAGDLDHLVRAVSCAPPTLAARATTFRMGEALLAGRIVSHPVYVRVGGRFTQEGGGDVPATWAAPAVD